MTRKLKIISHQENIGYNEALELQLACVKDIVEKEDAPYVIQFLEHKPVMTMGKAFEQKHMVFSKDQLKSKGIELLEVNRGGSITYHGPGQLVAYIHVHLKEIGLFLGRYLRDLEDWVIRVMKFYGIESGLKEGMTGVWTKSGKICAMGIAAKRYVSYHGLGVNFSVDLNCFNYIVPCGLGEPVASMDKIISKTPTRAELEKTMIDLRPEWLQDLEMIF